jgi:hypothetical protein
VSASVWDSPEMTGALGERLADDLRAMVRDFDAGAERSQQRHLGPSQIGNPCTRCLARHVLGMPIEREYDDPWCRILGTAGHSWLEEAAGFANAQALVDTDRTARWHPEVRVQPHPDLLPSGGKVDNYDEVTATVIDHKILGVPSLKRIRLNGPGQQYRVQVHTYGLGMHRLGKPVKHVALACWPRGGRLSDLYVWTEPFDVQVALDALKRYRTIREQALGLGPAILPLLPADPDCWDCEGKEMSADELAASTTQPNPAPAA